MPTTFADIDRECRQCRRRFTVTAAELEFLHGLAQAQPDSAWKLPANCADCRAGRRRQQRAPVVAAGSDEWLTCADCGELFIFGGRDREYLAGRGWVAPTRCRECRRARPARS